MYFWLTLALLALAGIVRGVSPWLDMRSRKQQDASMLDRITKLETLTGKQAYDSICGRLDRLESRLSSLERQHRRL